MSDQYLQEEYRLLGQQTTPRPRTEAEYNHTHASATLPCNKTKNRYTDVLPVEATRIKLAPREDEPGSDYINANQVTDPTPAKHDSSQNDHYICAQAPLQNTLNDFWRMVWEQDVCMIVVLMRLSENGKVKGHRYWPKRSRRQLHFNDITVTLVKGKHFPHRCEDPTTGQGEQTTIRVLELKKGSEKRNIVQLHFKDWPDFGVPESTEPIRNLVRIMDFYRERARHAGINGPVLIHCSAGIGRTGTYLAIVFALNAIKHMKQNAVVSIGSNSEDAGAFHSESPSYSDDEYNSQSGKSSGASTSASPQNSGTNGSPSAPVTPSKQSLSISDIPTTLSPATNPFVSPRSVISPQHESLHDQHSERSIPTQDTARSSPPPLQSRNRTLTGSNDSVEYETSLLLDSDEDEDDSSNSSTDTEEDMMEISSYQRPGAAIPVDIMKIVLSLRKQRNRGMVQTEAQYKFIYRVVFDELQQQRINVSPGVLQFMSDAANDFTDAAPLSARLSSSRRKSQPRSPRSTQISLGSSVSIGSSGLSRLSSSTVSSHMSISSSFSDDESERKSARLRSSGDSQPPLLTLDGPNDIPVYAPRRNLAMSSANIEPAELGNFSPSPPSSSSRGSGAVPPYLSQSTSTDLNGSASPSSSSSAVQLDVAPSPRRRSMPPGVTFSQDS